MRSTGSKHFDHALASASLVPQVTGAGDYHVVADEPRKVSTTTELQGAGQVASCSPPTSSASRITIRGVIGLALRFLVAQPVSTATAEAGVTLSVGGQACWRTTPTGRSAIISHSERTGLTLNNGTFTYTPNAGFTGVDTFSYTVSTPCSCSTNLRRDDHRRRDINAGAFGSAIAPVPGATDEFYAHRSRPERRRPAASRRERPCFNPATAALGSTTARRSCSSRFRPGTDGRRSPGA